MQGEVTERLENELCYDLNYELCSFSNLSVTSPTSQLILQAFRRFTYVTAHSPIIPLLHLRHSSFSNPSFHFPTSHALHVNHLASRPCCTQGLFRSWKLDKSMNHLLCRAAVVLTWFSDVNIVERVLDKYRNTLLCFKAFRYLVKRGKFTERVVNARTNKKYRIAREAYLRNLHSQ